MRFIVKKYFNRREKEPREIALRHPRLSLNVRSLIFTGYSPKQVNIHSLNLKTPQRGPTFVLNAS